MAVAGPGPGRHGWARRDEARPSSGPGGQRQPGGWGGQVPLGPGSFTSPGTGGSCGGRASPASEVAGSRHGGASQPPAEAGSPGPLEPSAPCPEDPDQGAAGGCHGGSPPVLLESQPVASAQEPQPGPPTGGPAGLQDCWRLGFRSRVSKVLVGRRAGPSGLGPGCVEGCSPLLPHRPPAPHTHADTHA